MTHTSFCICRKNIALFSFLIALVSFNIAPASADGFAVADSSENNGSNGQRVITFSGIDIADDAFAYYTGVLLALNGDFSRDGFVFRALGVSGDYEYDEITVPGGQVDADDRSIDIMIGYQKTIGEVTATAYIGFEYRDIELSPNDPGNEIQGDEAGFKVALDAETSDELPLFVSFNGAYSTAFDSWHTLLRVGYNMKRVVIGAEGLLSGVESDESQRLGGFATFRFNMTQNMPAELTANAGYQFVEDDNAAGATSTSGGEGAYGGLSLSISF